MVGGLRVQLLLPAGVVLIALMASARFGWMIHRALTGRVARSEKRQPLMVGTREPVRLVIAFLRSGNLWTIGADGSGESMLVEAPEGEPIDDFVWSPDGNRIYYCIGLRIYELVIATGNVSTAGEVMAAPGTVIDEVELANDGKTLLVSALDADAVSVLLAAPIGERESRLLTIDEYLRLSRRRTPMVGVAGDMSVSPDGRRILYKGLIETREEIMVADAEVGGAIQLSDLRLLEGFEATVETEGRRVIEAGWSPDGRYVIFLPMQSCSETGFCYGRLHLVDSWGGQVRQLSTELMLELPREWSPDGLRLVYDDGERVVLVDADSGRRDLAEGSRPKWRPLPDESR